MPHSITAAAASRVAADPVPRRPISGRDSRRGSARRRSSRRERATRLLSPMLRCCPASHLAGGALKAVEWFVKGLQDRGVDWISTLCGHGLDPLDFACHEAGLRLVDTRNEQSAAYMAEVHGRLTRRPGVAAVSSGVAHANAMTGVLSAHFDGAPMILVSGSHSQLTAGRGHFQDSDQVALSVGVRHKSGTQAARASQ